MTQPLLNLIFQQVKGINYYPINLKWRGNPALEVGDWVTMIDRKGKQFKSPVLNYTIVFDGGLNSTISADTKAYSSNVSTFKGPLQQKLDELDHRVDAAGRIMSTMAPKNRNIRKKAIFGSRRMVLMMKFGYTNRFLLEF